MERGIAVLGVSLGAQLIEASQGAGVYAAKKKEIGWHAISGTPQETPAFRFPAETDVFHWHGETFDLAANANNLASSASFANQAFEIGSRVIGLQFHLEVMRASVALMLDHGAADLRSGRYVQSKSKIRAADANRYATVQALMACVLDHLVG